MPKDLWDKAEIVSKIGGALLIPVVLGTWGVIWNSRFEVEQAVSGRIELAMAILKAPPIGDGSDTSIRQWAVSVLQAPVDPPEFPDRGEVLRGYIGQDTAICGGLKNAADEAAKAILANSDVIPDDVASTVARLIIGLDAGCEYDVSSRAAQSE